ncbi:amidohydrolase [Thalassospira lucentensis]|uniref:Amidohydrolase n=1 Tax=Thalassospira lucentensis TaxID=168935 RepID=A0A154L5V2_9PROT|nr:MULTISPECIES: amidohydrolase family protein [Thalassospira]KZB64798.1 amidohydrolase [Thalassospira lucentensis]MBO9507465.1 amidohydrolase family protein [Thalassospira sp. A3_1]MCH2275389.1 amidohydrolase family protein [Thalassospira sp.]
MLDYVVRNACLHGETGLLDIAIKDGIIADIAASIASEAPSFDAGGNLLTGGFVESHLHLDKACILDRAKNESGTLQGAISAVAKAKSGFTEDDVYARGAKVIEKAVTQGTNAIRTHVEIDPGIGLAGFRAIKRLKHDYAWAMDVEICVFPQEGLLNYPGTEELLREALDNGADLLGGCPYMDSDPVGQIKRLFEMARDYDVDLDFHLDFDLDPTWRHLDEVARQTIAFGWQGRVMIGHVTKLSVLPKDQLANTTALMRQAGIGLTVLPSTDLFLTGRNCEHSVPRGVAPAHSLARAGVCCTIATNNVLNPFTPFGDCSLSRMANLYANVSQLSTTEELEMCFAMVADSPAKLLGRPTEIMIGGAATFIALPAQSRAQVVSEISRPVWGMKDGRVTFEHPAPRLLHP